LNACAAQSKGDAKKLPVDEMSVAWRTLHEKPFLAQVCFFRLQGRKCKNVGGKFNKFLLCSFTTPMFCTPSTLNFQGMCSQPSHAKKRNSYFPGVWERVSNNHAQEQSRNRGFSC